MFEINKAKYKKQLKDLLEEREENFAEEKRIKEKLRKLEEEEAKLKAEGIIGGKQSFKLLDNDFDNISKDFIKDANEWIKQHEETHHKERFFETEDYVKNEALYLKPSYTATIDWTAVGRLVAVVCNTCKKHLKGAEVDSKDYMFCDEA